ncbi:DUF1254 domain-containing protein [Enterovirga rhinocerotis]|uniref:Cell envelope protein n=1 Tax=Enterovirga rhinocerotis TaxID=1339210 RepID=A0A4R7BN48_9HYPH|nr:DUF1254 domain-containing protein [Enterovirga rhinocerotis]TDR85347.1 hypothetical protein EV668_4468 [Enterovirga rhinocerotis]
MGRTTTSPPSRRQALLVLGGIAAGLSATSAATARAGLSGDQARELARQAYVYAYPLVKNYLSIYQFAIDAKGSQYKGPPNQVNNLARVFTPQDTGVITPNSDTPYSFLILDLRREPLVVTLPKIDDGRYYSLQIVDLYTNNVDYLGTRKDGNGGGDFLIAGPGWTGPVPAGIRRIVRLSTELGYSQFRTQLFERTDIDRVKAIQAGYRAVPLSAFTGTQAPPEPAAIDYPAISEASFDERFWRYANLLLGFCPVLEGERALRDDFARLGIGGGLPWPPKDAVPETVTKIGEGARQGHEEIASALSKVTSSAGLFGSPEEMAGKYLQRAVGAMGGIYGNTIEETLYPSYMVDEAGAPLDTAKTNYTLTFAPGALPPVDAFWSVTMYHADTQFLVENPLRRYLINSAMLAGLKRDPGGGITLHLQHASPGPEREANWLPAPDGPMNVVMRLYLPRAEALSGAWKAPPVVASGPAKR